jgi:hypothetical protein
MARRFLVFVACIVGVTTSAASGQTPLPRGFEINLLPGYAHQPLQGIDSIVGKLVKKDGLVINYEIGPVAKKGEPILGGSYVNRAMQLGEGKRLWLKEQTVGRRKFFVAYGKDRQLLVSTASEKQGVNFIAEARTPDDVADVLLMVLTFAEQQPIQAK